MNSRVMMIATVMMTAVVTEFEVSNGGSCSDGDNDTVKSEGGGW